MVNNIFNILLFIIIVFVIIFSTSILYNDTYLIENVYIINLKRRSDRFDSFLECYNKCGLHNYKLIKFNAIDGEKLDLKKIPMTQLAILEMKQLETIGFRYKHYQLTKGAIGCFLSHIKIWEHLVNSGKNNAIIFEDDARPPPNFKRTIGITMKHIPDDWDIVLFGKHCYDCNDYGKYIKVNKFILLHSYVINKKGVLKIFNQNTLFPISQQLDAYLSEITNILNIYSPKGNIVNQSNSRTDIQAPIIKHSSNNKRLNI